MNETLSKVIIVDNLAVDLAPKLTVEVLPEKRLLHVDWDEKKGELSYTIYSPEPEGDWVKQGPNLPDQIEDFWRKFDIILNDAIPRGSPPKEAWEGICLCLKGIGEWIFNKLIPSEVAERSREWQSGFSIRVSTNEQWIPWELMHDGDDFWGNKFIVARYPRVQDRKTLPVVNRLKTNGLKKIKGIVNVVGGGVQIQEAQKASELFNKLLTTVSVKLLLEKPVSELAKVLSIADVLHCTCHGHLQPLHLLQIASDKSPTQNLCIHTINSLPIKPGSLVFANACSSSTPTKTFGEFSNFGWEFYRQGADVFIGTLGIVPTKYAVSFAENFYKYLLCKGDKLTIGQAFAKTKKSASKEDNLFWLLYCIYGNPDICFEDI